MKSGPLSSPSLDHLKPEKPKPRGLRPRISGGAGLAVFALIVSFVAWSWWKQGDAYPQQATETRVMASGGSMPTYDAVEDEEEAKKEEEPPPTVASGPAPETCRSVLYSKCGGPEIKTVDPAFEEAKRRVEAMAQPEAWGYPAERMRRAGLMTGCVIPAGTEVTATSREAGLLQITRTIQARTGRGRPCAVRVGGKLLMEQLPGIEEDAPVTCAVMLHTAEGQEVPLGCWELFASNGKSGRAAVYSLRVNDDTEIGG